MPSLSAIIITHNEAADLPDCLASLAFCDEIVVVDSGSSDATVEIARSAGALVVVQPDWRGFGIQKQRALERASGDWVLSVDADERVPPALAAEIKAALGTATHDGYRLNRLSSFLGYPMRHGGWNPDWVLRLARRERAAFTPDLVHERLTVSGSVGDLRTPLLHLSYASVDEVLDKGRRYALASAAVRRRRGARGGLKVALLRSAAAFARHYLLQRGFLDGSPGLVAAIARAQETFWRYLAVGWEPDGSR